MLTNDIMAILTTIAFVGTVLLFVYFLFMTVLSGILSCVLVYCNSGPQKPKQCPHTILRNMMPPPRRNNRN